MRNLILGESLSELMDYRGKTPKKLGADFTESGVPVASALLVSNGVLDLSSPRFVSTDTYEAWMKTPTKRGDVILTSEAPLGRVARVPDDAPLVLGQRLFGLRGKPGVLDNGYLYYALQTGRVQADLVGRSSGTTVFGIRQSALRNVVIPAPAFEEQKAIAEVLGALDDKVAANAEAVRTLSLTADMLFEQIAGQSDETIPLGRLVRVTKGVSYKSDDLRESETALVTLKSFTRDGFYSVDGLKSYSGPFKHAQEIAPGEVVVAQTDLTQAAEVVGRSVRVPRNESYRSLVASLDLAIVRPSNGMPTEFLLGILRQTRFQQHCRSHARGTTVLHLGSNAIDSYIAPVVPLDKQLAFAEQVAPVHELTERISLESRTLAAARDVLLPQLMSGKLRVKDAETIVAAAV